MYVNVANIYRQYFRFYNFFILWTKLKFYEKLLMIKCTKYKGSKIKNNYIDVLITVVKLQKNHILGIKLENFDLSVVRMKVYFTHTLNNQKEACGVGCFVIVMKYRKFILSQ